MSGTVGNRINKKVLTPQRNKRSEERKTEHTGSIYSRSVGTKIAIIEEKAEETGSVIQFDSIGVGGEVPFYP